MTIRLLLAIAVLASACETSSDISARATYNRGVKALAKGELEKAEARFTKSISESGPDPDLRYRAALNLGLTYARKAEGLIAEKPEEALAELQKSEGWFRDAVRLRKLEKVPRENLELVVRKIQTLVDKLDKFRGLKIKLDKLIEDQRTLHSRLLALSSKLAGVSDPAGNESEFADLATFERTLLAEARTVGDLAADDARAIENKKEEERSQEESGKLIQLKNFDFYLQKSQGALADTRRELRRLVVDRSLARANDALENLKRAREQLLDPITVLRAIAEEQTVLLQHTAALLNFKQRGVSTDESAAPAKPPVWLTPESLATRQNLLGHRLTELTARFKAGSDAEPPAEADPKQKRMLAMAKRAVIPLSEAEKHVAEAQSALSASQLETAIEKEQQALLSMYRAMELFSEIKGLVELTHNTQLGLVGLLSPDNPANKDISTKDRAKRLREETARNLDRIARLKGMFEDEVAGLEAQATQAGQGAQAQGQAPSPEQLEQQKALYAQAETLRAQAETKLGELSSIIEGKGKGEALAVAQEGEASLKELRRLFFNVVEHLEELIAEQEQTRDTTGEAQGLPDDKRLEKFGPLVDRQSRHAAAGEAIEKALAEMADQAAQNPQAQQGGQAPPKFAEAAEEMRNANPPLSGAREELNTAREAAQNSSVNLEPAMELQDKALEHLRAALALLKPPKQDQQQQDQQKQDQQKQEDDVSQQQAQQRLQEAREREAERRRKKQQQPQSDNGVEKDW